MGSGVLWLCVVCVLWLVCCELCVVKEKWCVVLVCGVCCCPVVVVCCG